MNPSAKWLPFDADAILHRIEYAGRVCYRSQTKDIPRAFVRRLIASGHESVLEHCSLSAEIVCSRACSHQIVRHRLCAYSQESQRYVNYSKQGYDIIGDFDCSQAIAQYEQLLAEGCKPEEARSVLPNCMATRLVMTTNLRQWRHIFKERALNPHAQDEIRGLFKHLLDTVGLEDVFYDLR